MHKRLVPLLTIIVLLLSFTPVFASQEASDRVPGLTFTEDFTDTALKDANNTTANWSVDEEALTLNWEKAQYGVFDAGLTGSDISSDVHETRAIALGDVDGDGDLDLVAGNWSQINRLYLNNGTVDPFSGVTGTNISSDMHYTTSLALGDMDGDGDLDLVAGNGSGHVNRLYLNNGTTDPFNGVMGTNISNDAHNTFSVALGDVDGDGDLDMLAGNWVNQINRLYLNNGTADPFNGVTGKDISSDANWTHAIALGDMDGDGDLDMLAGDYDQTNRLYLNNGTADPFNGVLGTDISSDTQATYSIVIGDVDGDGDLDMVAGNFDQTNRLYLNNGTANPFSGAVGSDVSADAHYVHFITLGDVDSDGDLDLIAGNILNQVNRMYLNNGSSDPFSGVSGTDISSDAHYTMYVALGDVDGDGDLDMVAGNDSQTNRLYKNDGTSNPFNGVTGTDISSDVHVTFSIALGDVDGDGDLDMVEGNANETNRLYLNNGTSDPFNGVTGMDISSDAHYTNSITLGDVDGDGDLDMLAGNYNSQTNRLYKNNGTADPFNGVIGTDISSDTNDTFSIALGDVDGDGDLDMLAGNQYQTNRLYLNNGTTDPFSGVTGTDISSDAHNTYSVALGDVDRDGDLDMLAGNYNNQTNRLYLNNGTADPFNGVTPTNVSSDAHNTLFITLGDVDGDGDLDMLAGNHGQTNRLYMNNGTADPFSGVTGTNISSDTYATFAIALGDVDGDGDLDMLAGNYNNQTNRMYKNNGTADPFGGVTGTAISSDAHWTTSIALGDVDGDGDLDLLAGNVVQTNRLYLNQRTASPFRRVISSDVSTDANATRSIALGDVDGDGDLDMLAGNTNNQTNRLYKNNGTADPFSGVMGTDISSDAHNTWPIVLGDVDGDGDLDMLAGNFNQTNRLYLNNGSTDPFDGVMGTNISSDAHSTTSIALGDVDGDGDLDMLVGNTNYQTNRLYKNNGSTDPFSGVIGTDISSDAHNTWSIVLGDVDGDGDLDVLAGNEWQTNRLYLNNGTTDPFFEVTGTNISNVANNTASIVLGDVDGDGDLDMLEGNYGTNYLYKNNGTADPFNGVTGTAISSDAQSTNYIVLGDVNGDGDLDLLTGNYPDQTSRLYLNNGTADPFNEVVGTNISSDGHKTWSIALGDVDGDGDLDLLAGNENQINRLYLQAENHHTGQGLATSLRVDTETSNIPWATLTATAELPINTNVTYYLSNNGGVKWFIVQPGVSFVFPTSGMDLRWKAELQSLSPILTPKINQIQIMMEDVYFNFLPMITR